MLLLAQAVPGPDTPGTKRGICLRQVRSWPHDLCRAISRSRRRSRSGPQPASLAPYSSSATVMKEMIAGRPSSTGR
jgi:hypothetical protein